MLLVLSKMMDMNGWNGLRMEASGTTVRLTRTQLGRSGSKSYLIDLNNFKTDDCANRYLAHLQQVSLALMHRFVLLAIGQGRLDRYHL